MKCVQESAPVVLRGARRVNKGNRISCLIGQPSLLSPYPPPTLTMLLEFVLQKISTRTRRMKMRRRERVRKVRRRRWPWAERR